MPVRGGHLTQSLDQHYFENVGQIGQVRSCVRVHRRLKRVEDPCAVADNVCVFARMEEEGAPELWVLEHDLWEGGEGGDSNAHGARHSDARGSYEAPVRTVGEPSESRGTAG